jgi:hypothetical protein
MVHKKGTMPNSSTASTHRSSRVAITFVATSLLLAVVDIVFASTYWNRLYGVPPARLLQGIAAGLLGAGAYRGGAGTICLGAVLHVAIMFTMVGTYFLASRRAVALTEHPWPSGLLYGLLLYIVMNWVVLPLSAAAKTPFVLSWVICSIVMHMVVIGLSIALSARWAMHRSSRIE